MSSSAAPRAVLFDLDGTLIDTYHLYLEAYTRALEPYIGRRPSLEEFVERRPASERHFLNAWIGEENARACHAAMRRYYAELHASLFEGVYDGVPEMLKALRTAGVPVGIVTGKGRHTWETTEAALGLGPFAVVITDDEMELPKPDPGGLHTALETLGAEAGETVYVGDSLSDLEAGRQAGTRVAAALWPKTAPGEAEAFAEQIRPLDPDWVFERPADVVRAFAMWCG
jgi:pyrophosphatase PpaX